MEEEEGVDWIWDRCETGEEQSQGAKAEHCCQAKDRDVGGNGERLLFEGLLLEVWLM